MSKTAEQAIKEYQDRVARGDNLKDIIFRLHEDGLTILDSIKAIRTLYGINLGDAKQYVSEHPVWADVIRAHEPFHNKLEKLGEIPSYGTWLELHRFGFRKKGLLSISTDAKMQREIEVRLKNVVEADEETQQKLIRELASFSGESILQVLLAILNEQEKPLLELVIQTIHKIGFPRNAVAIPWLVDCVSDLKAPGRGKAIQALEEMHEDAVVPFFVAILLNRDDSNDEWSYAVNGICDVLRRREGWRLACAPTISYLLAQHDYKPGNTPDIGALLSVLELTIPVCAYAIPAIYTITLQKGGDEVGKKARQLLGLFDEATLKPYQYRLEWLSE